MDKRVLLTVPALATLAILMIGCGGSPEVNYDFDTMANWSDYRSFNFLPTEGTADVDMDDGRIKRAIVLDLTGRGYLQGGNGPMMLISHRLGWQGDKEVLTVEFVDEHTSRRLWTGNTVLEDMDGTGAEQDVAMQKNVSRLLSYFPPPKEG
jgi:hypothetical protein